MIKIQLNQRKIVEIKQNHIKDLQNRNIFEEIKNHISCLQNLGYKHFFNLFKEDFYFEGISENKIEELVLLDNKIKMKKFIFKAEKAIEDDAKENNVSIKKVKEDILGNLQSGFLKFYNNFSNRKWAYEYLKIIECNVCPYCNRMYTFTVDKKNKSRPEFDHYFPKSIYPYLAITIFNLIPSCSLCNKGKSDVNKLNCNQSEILYPFEESFEDEDKKIRFEIYSETIDYLYGKNDDIQIILRSQIDNDRNKGIINKYNENLKISNLYSMHTDYVKEMIKKDIIYNDSMIDELLEEYSDIFSSDEEINSLIYGNYIEEKDYNKRPLAKFTHDLLIDFNN